MSDPIDFRTLKRPSSPNTYLLAPEGLTDHADPDLVSPLFNMAAPQFFDTVKATLSEKPRTKCVHMDRETLTLVFVSKTPLVGFKDDIDVLVVPSGDSHSKIAMYSRSRVGYSDLGANEKRVNTWLDALKQSVSST